ncbi:All-trans-phytoene synthase [Corynebacterium faecale]|uniref:phytoene/squalene synthase family protein n=1 Tax=Corynebacterium faecale TaxID=1758466 RepID=UPI0025B4EEF3|nr:phytoene/squalene synthase family protein [Corynebacterium faecale]WJY91395.1 All-trans-phytoene synthase [Corynebacterium faecale]
MTQGFPTGAGSPRSASFLHSALGLYNRVAVKASHQVIKRYSTSFSMSTLLLSPQIRRDIRNLYAVVRIADEIVDGTAEAAGYTPAQLEKLLDDYEAAVLASPEQHFHTDLVLQAYGETARRCNFQEEHVVAFFASMRRDLTAHEHDPGSFEAYVYGSAEVIGLLCLSVFNQGRPVSARRQEEMKDGARALGAAFQKINFLRDLAEDQQDLGRTYFPGTTAGALMESEKQQLIADIRIDLEAADRTYSALPVQARIGVIAAALLFEGLTDRIEQTPAEKLLEERISIPQLTKLQILGRATARGLAMSIYRKKSA